VLLHEYVEDEDDPLSTAFKLFDIACYGAHPVAQPVIGTRANIERFTRADLLDYVQRQYSGENIIVGAAGNIDPETVVRAAQAAFGSMRRGSANVVDAPVYAGGVRTRRQSGHSQTHVVVGYPVPPSTDDAHHASVVAAALFGEGMSSPLMDEIRERRGLVYYAACSADVADLCGQFVVEASTLPEHLDEFLAALKRLLAECAVSIDAVALERARNQMFVHGRVRSRGEILQRIEAIGAAQVLDAFGRMLAQPPAVAVAGRVRRVAHERIAELLGAHA
jgi:predicted Zn-dependent peptidase